MSILIVRALKISGTTIVRIKKINVYVKNHLINSGSHQVFLVVRIFQKDLFVRLLITSSPVVAKAREGFLRRKNETSSITVANEEETCIKYMFGQ